MKNHVIAVLVVALVAVGVVALQNDAPLPQLGAAQDPQNYNNLTADTYVKKGNQGTIRGIFVASATSDPSLQVLDADGTSTSTLVNTFTPTAATYYDMGDPTFINGLYINVGGTVDVTVIYD